MKSAYESQLRKKAEELIEALDKREIFANILEDSFREYNVKIHVSLGLLELGLINMYYSPKKNSFKLVLTAIKNEVERNKIEDIWFHMLGEIPNQKGYQAYVDGSFLNGKTGYGFVVLKENKIIVEKYGPVDLDLAPDSRQVAGEIEAVKQLILWCQSNKIKTIVIHYDYQGLKMWPEGLWKAKQPLTRAYVDFVRKSTVKIVWNKVAAHTGNRWNELADSLAKKGTQIVLKKL